MTSTKLSAEGAWTFALAFMPVSCDPPLAHIGSRWAALLFRRAHLPPYSPDQRLVVM
ncbi:hypothetical protein GUITHDRAFT_156214, partial [Guillardia theta CCMP2712]